MSKVKYNIHDFHYAKKSVDESGKVTFGTPVAIPGAVAIALEQQGELTPFWADGIKYYVSSSNGGYEGDLEVAMIPDSFRTDILGEILDANKVLFENADIQATEFAAGFAIDGDTGSTYFWFYNCTATKPGVDAKTTEDNKTPDTDKITISCASDASGIVRAKTTEGTDKSILNNWFKSVYQKAETEQASNQQNTEE